MSHRIAQKKSRIFACFPSSPRQAQRRYRERPAKVFVSEEIRLDDDLRLCASEVLDDEGRPITTDFERWSRGGCKPLSIFAHYIVRVAKRGGDEQRILDMVRRLEQFVRAVFHKYGRHQHARRGAA